MPALIMSSRIISSDFRSFSFVRSSMPLLLIFIIISLLSFLSSSKFISSKLSGDFSPTSVEISMISSISAIFDACSSTYLLIHSLASQSFSLASFRFPSSDSSFASFSSLRGISKSLGILDSISAIPLLTSSLAALSSLP